MPTCQLTIETGRDEGRKGKRPGARSGLGFNLARCRLESEDAVYLMVSLEFAERQGLVPLLPRDLFRLFPSAKENRPRISKFIDFRAFFSFEWSF